MKLIQLGGKHSDKYAKVSDEDYEILSQYKWYYMKGYAVCTIKGKGLKMHRMAMNVTDPQILVDHRDRDKLNNQRENLHMANEALNAQNRGLARPKRKRSYTGVERATTRNGYRAVLTRNGKRIISSLYASEIAAAIRYNQMVDENGGLGLKNEINLSVSEQLEVLKRDSPIKSVAIKQSGVKGVSFHAGKNKWIITRTINGKRKEMGAATLLEDAIRIAERCA